MKPQIILIIAGWPSAYETAEDAWNAYQSAKKVKFLIDGVAIPCSEDDPAACHVQIEEILTHYKYVELPEPITLESFEHALNQM